MKIKYYKVIEIKEKEVPDKAISIVECMKEYNDSCANATLKNKNCWYVAIDIDSEKDFTIEI